ncbi:MAG: DUF1538 domain-containing protein [Clostridia bacterium]|nr:DUF1538 domain-containing protein [Clostridia bacterium]
MSVIPIVVIVLALSLTVVPVSPDLLLSFLLGAVLLTIGMGLFSVGSEVSMTQIGTQIGSHLTKTKNLKLILAVSLLLGIAITVAEPDLQVLAANVPNINTLVLIVTVAIGVGLFLMASMLRILFNIPLRWLLMALYVVVFLLAFLTDPDYLSVAFDSGGVTTGPMTVPFILALGIGVASIRSDEKAQMDSFGLVALCSIGPILAVLILSFIYKNAPDTAVSSILPSHETTLGLGRYYLESLPTYIFEVVIALLPIIVFFLVFHFVSLKLRKIQFLRIMLGLLVTCAGLILFLLAVNVGFSSLGHVLGQKLAEPHLKFLLIPIAMIMGWFIINAEPAVAVLNKQVEELSAGAISAKAMNYSLAIAISIANGLAMLRVITGMNIMWIIVPGYAVSLLLAFFVPQTFTAIAFDSGGVASGPLTATFMLPFAMGASTMIGGNIMTDAFGLVALVAMMPLLSVQLMGLIYVIKTRKAQETVEIPYAEDEIIELWEV